MKNSQRAWCYPQDKDYRTLLQLQYRLQEPGARGRRKGAFNGPALQKISEGLCVGVALLNSFEILKVEATTAAAAVAVFGWPAQPSP